MHDLDPVAGCKPMRVVLTARYDGFIELERNAPANQVELREQVGDGGAESELVRFAVENDFHAPILSKPIAAGLRLAVKGS